MSIFRPLCLPYTSVSTSLYSTSRYKCSLPKSLEWKGGNMSEGMKIHPRGNSYETSLSRIDVFLEFGSHKTTSATNFSRYTSNAWGIKRAWVIIRVMGSVKCREGSYKWEMDNLLASAFNQKGYLEVIVLIRF